MRTAQYKIVNPHHVAVINALRASKNKRITLDEINRLPIFDGLRDIKEVARAAKVALVKKGILRMVYRGVYTFND